MPASGGTACRASFKFKFGAGRQTLARAQQARDSQIESQAEKVTLAWQSSVARAMNDFCNCSHSEFLPTPEFLTVELFRVNLDDT